MSWQEGFLWGALGGLFAELLGLFQLRHQAPNHLPAWLSTVYYWVVTLTMIFAGGILCVAYIRSGFQLKPLTAINIGASAPLLIGAFVSRTPPSGPGRIN